jgi:hypothetical protein
LTTSYIGDDKTDVAVVAEAICYENRRVMNIKDYFFLLKARRKIKESINFVS